MRKWGWGVGAVLFLGASPALSNSGGRPGASGLSGDCNQCHTGGTAPKVTLSGPTALDAGSRATYTFLVETEAGVVGMGATVDDSLAKLFADPDGGRTDLQGEVPGYEVGDITHLRPERPDGGAVRFSFSLEAPPYASTMTLYAAGNACDGDRSTSGDRAAKTRLTIEINGPPRPVPEAGVFDAPTPSPTPTATPPLADGAFADGALVDAEREPPSESGCSVGRSAGDSAWLLLSLVFTCCRRLRKGSQSPRSCTCRGAPPCRRL